MSVFLTLPLILLFVFLLEKGAKKLQIPSVVALIASGLILGLPLFKTLLSQGSLSAIGHLGDLALLCLMFLAGLDTSTREMKHETREALAISLLAALLPFTAGLLIFWTMGFPIAAALVVGVSMSITAEATTVALLLEMGKAKTKLGTLMMEAGIIDDVLGLAAFILISFFFGHADLQQNSLVSGSILLFFVGVLIQNRWNHHPKLNPIKKILLFVFVPFFFVSMGLNFDLSSLLLNPLLLLVTLGVAFLGKFGGSLLAKPFTTLSWRQLTLVGWAMNSRGAIGLALGLIALRSELISVDLYSALVVMSLLTTIIFPFPFKWMVKKEPGLME